MNNPYGSYTRHNTTTAEHMAALWKEVAREHAARSSSARQHARDCHDSMDAAIRRANKAEFDAATYRADRDAAEEERDEAVRERDELRQIRRRLLGKVDRLEVKLRNIEGPEPRPLDSEVADKEWLDARYEAALDQVGGCTPPRSASPRRTPRRRTEMAQKERERSAEEVERAVIEICQEADALEDELATAHDRIEELEAALRDAGVEVPA